MASFASKPLPVLFKQPLPHKMPHLLLLRLQIKLVRRLTRHLCRHPLHPYPERLQRRHLLRVIRHQPNRRNIQHPQHLRRQLKVPAVSGVSQFQVGLDRIPPMVLQLIRLQLRHQANPAAFLVLVEQDPTPFLGNRRQRKLELLSAIAPQRMKHIARQALRMNPYQRSLARIKIAHHQRHGRFNPHRRRGNRIVTRQRIFNGAFKTENAEVPPTRREIGIGKLA